MCSYKNENKQNKTENKTIKIRLAVFRKHTAQTLNDDYRLPNSVIPLQYNISLRPYLIESGPKLFTFDGAVTIKILAKEDTNTIALHSKSLDYKIRQYWTDRDDTAVNLTSFQFDENTSIVKYTLSQNLIEGDIYYLHFEYTGILDDDMQGFYRSSYVNKYNETKWMSVSFFAPNYARRAFPCWDEPSFKAIFVFDITRPKTMTSYTNTRLLSTLQIDNDYAKDYFAETPLISTYLSAFLVGEFRERSNGDYAIIAQPDFYEQTGLAFDVGQRLLTYLGNYFNINYYDMGIPKLALAAIPDFSAGAMENWGLISYKEKILLFDENSSSLRNKMDTTSIIGHEQTHLWFGDLVTCGWWSYTWLNEGFAEYFQFAATHAVESSYELDKQFVVEDMHTVMVLDATNGTNPMNDIGTDTASLLQRNFNLITYNKGSSFIRMVKHTLGEGQFQNSLRNYIQDRQYNVSEPQDIYRYWSANFPSEYGMYAEDFFQSFTWQVGYPVVNVELSKDHKSFKVSQKRFLLNSTDGSDPNLMYTLPFTYTTNLRKNFLTTTPVFFLTKTNDSKWITLPQAVDWVIANIQQVGYYRVNYDDDSWQRIHKALVSPSWSSIHELNRAQLVNDLFNLARAQEISYDRALHVIEYLSTETNYLPWYAAFNGLSHLSKRLGFNQDFSAFFLKLTNKAYNSLGFVAKSSDKPLDILLRTLILTWNCRHGHESCISMSKSHFRNISKNSIPVNIRLPVYCTAMREGSAADFDVLVRKYKTDTVPTERSIILQSLGCVRSEWLIREYLRLIISDDVRRQDKSMALSSIYSNNYDTATTLLRAIRDTHASLAKSLGGYSSLASVIVSIADCFTTEEQLADLQDFNRQYKTEFGKSAATLMEAENAVRINLDWQVARLGIVRQYIQQPSSGSLSLKSNSLAAILFIACLFNFHIKSLVN